MIDDEDERGLEVEAKTSRKARDRAKREKELGEQLDDAYKAVMGMREGRMVMWDLLGKLGLYQTPMVVGSQDLTYSNIGRHNAALELVMTLNEASEDDFLLMHKENRK